MILVNRNQHHNASTSYGAWLVNRRIVERYWPYGYSNAPWKSMGIGYMAANAGAYRCNEKQL